MGGDEVVVGVFATCLDRFLAAFSDELSLSDDLIEIRWGEI